MERQETLDEYDARMDDTGFGTYIEHGI